MRSSFLPLGQLLLALALVADWPADQCLSAEASNNKTGVAKVRTPRQVDFIQDALGFVGRTISGRQSGGRGGRGGGSSSSSSREIYDFTYCPENPTDRRLSFQKLFMLFHQPDDKPLDELRMEENERYRWDTDTLDLLVTDYGFKPNKSTLMYTGGFSQDAFQPWLMDVRKNYDLQFDKNKADYNLLFFDWSSFGHFYYDRSVQAVPQIASRLADLFEYLRAKHGLNLAKLHMISYSLSTHIIGLAARQLASAGHRVGQITYLDPTGVCFHDGRSWGDKYGARADDALVTVARHYNMRGFGAGRFIGGLDVVVNDGKVQPPMEGLMRPVFRRLASFSLSSHLRAGDHERQPFVLEADCHEIAYACSSYESFQAGHCGSCGANNETCLLASTVGNLEIGRDANQLASSVAAGTRLYLNTGRKQYCAYQYQVVASMTRNDEKAALKFEPAPGVKMAPVHKMGNNKLTQLLVLEKRISSFEKRLELASGKLPKSLRHIRINYLSHLSPKRRAMYSAKYCPDTKSGELVKC